MSDQQRANYVKKEQLHTRIIGLGLLAVISLVTGALLRERTTAIAILLGMIGMSIFLYWGILLYGYRKTYRVPV